MTTTPTGWHSPRGASVSGCLTMQVTSDASRIRRYQGPSEPRTSLRRDALSGNGSGAKERARKRGFRKLKGRWVKG